MSTWNVSIFLPEAADSASILLSMAVWPSQTSSQFSVELKDGVDAPWVGCNAALTDDEIAALQELIQLPGVRWYRWGLDGTFGAAYDDRGTEGDPWSWAQSVAAAGLTLVQPPLTLPS